MKNELIELNKIVSIFKLENKEEKIFSLLLLHYLHGLSISDLWKKTRLPRGTLYDILKSLTEKKLVKKEAKHGALYKIVSLDELELLLEEQKVQSERNIELFKNQKQLIIEKFKAPPVYPHVNYQEGISHFQSNYSRSLQSKEKLVRAIIPEKKMVELLGNSFLDNYLEMRIKRDIFMRVLATEKDLDTKTYLKSDPAELREVIPLPSEHEFLSTILIFDNSVNFFTLTNEVISVEIESHEYATTMKSLFDSLWKK